MKKSQLLRIAALLTLACSASVQAGVLSFSGLFPTGVDAGGAALPGGSADPHYTVLEAGDAPASVLTSVPSFYHPNTSSSSWIWQNADATPNGVTRTFRTTFTITGTEDLAQVRVNGVWATDNSGLIRINGVDTGLTSGSFKNLSYFRILSGFQTGENTIDFVVLDSGGIAGLQVTELSAELLPVPEPEAYALAVGAGLVGFALWRRRKA